MQRRELLKLIAAATGCAFIGRDELFAGPDTEFSHPYSEAEIGFFDEVAETILPRTDTPGAKDAGLGAFMARYSAACYPQEHIERLKAGLADIESRMQASARRGFLAADLQERAELLMKIDHEAKEHVRAAGDNAKDQPHYFTLLKQLILFGFFTSEQGATEVCRYRPIPGRYKGCVPYQGEAFWAW